MEGGGAHLGSSLPMSAFIHRQSFSCAGGRLRSRAPFSFAGVVFVRGRCFRSWAVTFVGGWSSSPSFVGVHLFMGGCAVGVVVLFVWYHGGHLVCLWVIVIMGGRAVGGVQCWGVGGKLVCGGGVW